MPYGKKAKALTNKGLRNMFRHYNEVLFKNFIDKDTNVCFRNLWASDDSDGLYLPGIIMIDSHLRWIEKYTRMVLIHEMCHAALPEYLGDHGPIFQAKLVEMFNKGAYEGLLTVLLFLGLAGSFLCRLS